MGNCNNSKPTNPNKDIQTRRGTIILSHAGLDSLEQTQLYKVLVIGESSVGKSSIVLQYTENKFEETHISTIGVDFRLKQDVNVGGKSYRLQIWDTAGQERYRTISNTFYRGVKGVLIVYDASYRASFEQVERWVQEIHQNSSDDVAKILVGNKIDLPREVTTEEGKALADKVGALFVETSARERKNIDECFNLLLKNIISKGL